MAEEIEILISEDGSEMKVAAHNFQGNGCEALVRAFEYGAVTESRPTSDYFRQHTQKHSLRQGR